jgi:hypothetical protein
VRTIKTLDLDWDQLDQMLDEQANRVREGRHAGAMAGELLDGLKVEQQRVVVLRMLVIERMRQTLGDAGMFEVDEETANVAAFAMAGPLFKLVDARACDDEAAERLVQAELLIRAARTRGA